MKTFDYFKKTSSIVFVFITIYKITLQLFEGLSSFTKLFFIKTLITALITGVLLGILNCFFKINIYAKSNK